MARRTRRGLKALNGSGFTLAETLVSLAVFSFFAVVMYSGVSAMNKMNSQDTTQRVLLNKARLVMEKIVWGAGLLGSSDRDGLAEAVSYSQNGNGTFHYSLPDGVDRTIVQSQDELTFHKGNKKTTIYDPNGVNTPPDPQNYSTNLTFTEITPGVLQVNLVLGQKENGVWKYASLSTAVALRN